MNEYGNGNVIWPIIDDDLQTPHEGIITEIGKKTQLLREKVIDWHWRTFDWSMCQTIIGSSLKRLCEKWMNVGNFEADLMSK